MSDLYKENYDLREKVKELQIAIQEIHSLIYRIGGPLNDSVKQYSKKQMKTFFKISSIVDQFGGNSED